MPSQIPAQAQFVVHSDIAPRSLAPEQRRAKRSTYCPEAGFGVFPYEIAEEGGPDRSVYLMGAQWEGVTHMASQEDDMRDGYFISARRTGSWRWVLWRCSWDDNESAWFWSSAGATSWNTKDPAAAGKEMIRRLWASWRSQETPNETDALGLLDRNDIEDLVSEVFLTPSTTTDGDGMSRDKVPAEALSQIEPDREDTPHRPENLTDAEWLASTSDADLARLLGIHYRGTGPSEQPPGPTNGPYPDPEGAAQNEQG